MKELIDSRYIIEWFVNNKWERRCGLEYQSWLIKKELNSLRLIFPKMLFRALEFKVRYSPWTYKKPERITEPTVVDL